MTDEVKVEEKELPDRLVVSIKGAGRRGPQAFVDALHQAFKDGYVPAPSTSGRADATKIFPALKQVVLYKEGFDFDAKAKKEAKVIISDKEAVERAKAADIKSAKLRDAMADLENLSKKVDLVAHAKDLGIDIPKDCKQPAAIKSLIAQHIKK